MEFFMHFLPTDKIKNVSMSKDNWRRKTAEMGDADCCPRRDLRAEPHQLSLEGRIYYSGTSGKSQSPKGLLAPFFSSEFHRAGNGMGGGGREGPAAQGGRLRRFARTHGRA